jgi:GTP1/Obg family GTP-binding protein
MTDTTNPATIELPLEKPSPTPEVIDKQLDAISKHADKNERLAWIRKMKKLQELVTTLEPFEQQIFEIIMKKQPIVDEINDIRNELVKVCIHPKDSLAHLDTHAICKFCNRKISLPEVDTGDDE